MNEIKNITQDSRFRFPVPGVLFQHKGQEVDLRKITDERALQLAADESCKFIYLAQAAAPKPATDGKGGK